MSTANPGAVPGAGTRLFDLHAHPSLKMYYLPYLRSTLHATVYSGGHFNPLSFRTRYANLKDSPVRVVVNAHYVIEREFIRRGFRWLSKVISWALAPGFMQRLVTADPWRTLLRMMDYLDETTDNTNRWLLKRDRRVRVVSSFEQLQALPDNEIGLVHAIEGAHAMGFPEPGQSPEAYWEQTRERLGYLKRRGVAMFGLAHFFDNPFAPQTDATEIVAKERNGRLVGTHDDMLVRMRRAEWTWGDAGHFAEAFVRELLRLGILVDVSHVQEHARDRIYDLCAEAARPVVASHVGLQRFFRHEYNMRDDEVKRIRTLGGVVGLILSKRWLVDPVDRHHAGNDGIPDLIDSMRHLRDLTGDVDVIGIGTDFDGLTHPFAECFKPNQLGRIAHAMGRHFSDDEIDRILFRNAWRCFERGWT